MATGSESSPRAHETSVFQILKPSIPSSILYSLHSFHSIKVHVSFPSIKGIHPSGFISFLGGSTLGFIGARHQAGPAIPLPRPPRSLRHRAEKRASSKQISRYVSKTVET